MVLLDMNRRYGYLRARLSADETSMENSRGSSRMFKPTPKPLRSELPARQGCFHRIFRTTGSCAALAMIVMTLSTTAWTQTTPLPAFQQEMQRNYQDLFQAAIITGVADPNGTSMSLEQLLAAANRNGLRRLNDQWIGELIPLRAQLAYLANTRTCASLWSGSVEQGFVPAIETLNPQQQRLWAEIFDQAARAVINHTPIRPAPSPAEYQPALSGIMSKMAPPDLAALNEALADSTQLAPDQECNAARALYGGIARANRADALTITRAMLYR